MAEQIAEYQRLPTMVGPEHWIWRLVDYQAVVRFTCQNILLGPWTGPTPSCHIPHTADWTFDYFTGELLVAGMPAAIQDQSLG